MMRAAGAVPPPKQRDLKLLRWLWPPRADGTRRSVRSKLMIVVVQTTGIALFVASAALLVNDLTNYRRVRAADLATEASILALASAPALTFDDHAAAVDSLATLRVHQAARAAALYTADGRLYAQFVRPGERPPPAQLPRSITGTYMRGTQIEEPTPEAQAEIAALTEKRLRLIALGTPHWRTSP